MSVRSALARGVRRLAAAGIEGPAGDARRIMAWSLGVEQGRVTLHLDEPMPKEAQGRFGSGIARRCEHVPVSQIVGYRAFWGRRVAVTPDVLDPRPETEGLVAAALEAPFATVLDLGTGSGAILLTLLAERTDATGLGTDISDAALSVAAGTAEAWGVAARATFARSDWYDDVEGRFDLIVSNPPYIAAAEMETLGPGLAHEPRGALTDEGDGLSAYRAIAAGARDHLAPSGRLLVEIGWTQGAAVCGIFTGAGLADVAVRPDLDGRDRIVTARAP